jgi:predicted dithiol-disulfide oxidoreductase (DUF899 family)
MTTNAEIQKIEKEIMDLSKKLSKLRRDSISTPVKNYELQTSDGKIHLLDLFAGKNFLFAIHNMGQACRYCTLWADGLNSFLPHLEDQFSVVLLSKDTTETQRRFANSRGWRFRMASHAGSEYVKEQSISGDGNIHPGLVCYERKGDQIFKKNASSFGPGDQFCSLWHIISLAGYSEDNWTPQYQYWKRPEKMDDGGQNIT